MLWPLLVGAAFLGDVVNYLIGRWFGGHLLSKPRKYLKPEHVRGGTRVLRGARRPRHRACRFLPIVRTLVPFVAGATRMEFHRYLGVRRPCRCPLGDDLPRRRLRLFGNVQWVQDYLAVALAIAVAASTIPGFIIWGVHHLRSGRSGTDG